MTPCRSNLASAAFRLALRALPVFPLKPRTKKPAVAGGFHSATTDLDVVRAWWRRWPTANIGVPTGLASRLWVLDIDGDEGEASLRRLVVEHGPLPATVEAISGGGGRHLYWAWPNDGPEIGSSSGRVAPRIDVKGARGSIIVPPSIHPNGASYRWPGGKPGVAQAPDWLVKLTQRPPPPPRPAPKPLNGDVDRYCAAAIVDELRRLEEAGDGQRNDVLNRSAFAVGGFVAAGVVPDNWARETLGSRAVQIGLPVHEARGTIDSAFKAARPRELPR